ncbi:MAG TPA: hypothetical protein VIH58_00750 [Chthoniobacterales bacterium]
MSAPVGDVLPFTLPILELSLIHEQAAHLPGIQNRTSAFEDDQSHEQEGDDADVETD